MIPREYQEWGLDAIFQYYRSGNTGNPIVAMPTGTGKSPVIAWFIQRCLFTAPATRCIKATHSKELIGQNLDELLGIWPNAPVGVFSAGLKLKQFGYPIIYGGIGSLVKADPEIFGHVDILLIDECDLVSPKDKTMYRLFIVNLKIKNPRLTVIGFTATYYRLGQGMLTEGEDALFTDVCFDATSREAFNWFIAQGYLTRLVPKKTQLEIDVSQVHTVGGEYNQKELQQAADQDDITYAACQEMIEQGHDRKRWLVFGTGIQHVINIAAMLNSLGISTTFVHSDTKLMPEKERDENIKAHKEGRYRAIVNNGILTTGYNDKKIDLIGFLLATKSARRWVQSLGRGTRPWYAEGYDLNTQQGRLDAIKFGEKPDCLVMDFGGNTKRLGPINDPVLPKAKGKGGGGVAPIRLCDVCGCYNHASATECEFCGNPFPRRVNISDVADTEELIAEEERLVVEIFKVDRVTYAEHRKMGSPPSIKVNYYCGLRLFKEYVGIEHGGRAKDRARTWWRDRYQGEDTELPPTTLEAMKSIAKLKDPTHIRVWIKKKNDEILGYDFTGTAFNGAIM